MCLLKCIFLLLLHSFTFNAYVRAAEDPEGYHTFNKHEYPNPVNPKEAASCGRSRPSQFCNAQSLPISSKQASQIDEIIRKIGNDTGCICEHGCPDDGYGLSVGVALLKTAEEYSSNYLNDYADYLRKKWRLGSCQNGILLLIVVKKGLITVSMGDKAHNALGSGFFDGINNLESRNIKNETILPITLSKILESYYVKTKELKLNPASAKSAVPNVILIIAMVFGSILLLICFVGILFQICSRKRRKT